MTAAEIYEMTTHGGTTDFARIIRACESTGPYCLIGGLAVNCYVEPVYTLDAGLVVTADEPKFTGLLQSSLRIQLTSDPRYQEFLDRAVEAEVLGIRVRVACLEDVTRGKLWAYSDPQRRFSKRKKDELDLIRLAEAYPELISRYPEDLRKLLERP